MRDEVCWTMMLSVKLEKIVKFAKNLIFRNVEEVATD